MKAYGYLRVSGAGQIGGHGFDRQLESVQAFCVKAGYQLDRVFKEQVSGTKGEADRPEFSSMIAAILKNGCNTIIVESLDRLAREYRIQEQLLIYLASKDINLIATNTGENVTKAITEDPMRKAMVQMQGIFAELEKSLLVKKLRNAREQIRKDTGRCEGAKPYYSTEAGMKVIQEIKRLRRKKPTRKRMSFNQIAERLNQDGFQSANGKPFTGNSVSTILHRATSKKRSGWVGLDQK